MANVGVTFDFAAESAKLRSEVDKVRKELGTLNATTKSIKDGFSTLGGVIAGAFSISALMSFMSKSNQVANQLADLSTRLGASASGLQVLQVAAVQAGGSAEGVNTALAKMSATIGDAVIGNKAAAEAFDRLGLSAKEVAGLKADEAFRRIAGAVGEIPNSFERASVAQDIFGKGAKDIAGLLAEGTKGIDDANRALAEQGALLSDIDVSKIDQMNDALAFQSTVVTNLGIKFLANLSPAVGVATQSFAGLMEHMGGATEAGKTFGVVLTAAIKMIESAVYALGAVFESMRFIVAAVMTTIVAAVGKVIGTLATAAELLGLDMAVSLRAASDNANLMADSLNAVALSAKANAQAAAAAAIQAGADVFRAGEIFDEQARKLEERAAAVSASMAGGQGAPGTVAANTAAAAAGKTPGISVSGATLGEKFDPVLDPRVINEQMIADSMLAIQEQYGASRIGQIEALDQSVVGMALAASQQQADFSQLMTNSVGQNIGTMVGSIAQATGILGKNGKAYAIAQTIWSTGVAIMRAMELPWPVNIAAVAAAAAMGIAQLANIKKTNIGSGGSIAGAKASAPSATSPSMSDNVPGTQPATDQYKTVTQVVIQGNVFSSQETADWLAEKIAEAVNGRDMVFISPNSRQAMELRG